MRQKIHVILGSTSPQRRQILTQAGIACEMLSPDIDERSIRNGDPGILTQALAGAKAIAITAKCRKESAIIITADQVAVYRGEIREKPADEDEAYRWLMQYDSIAPVEFVTSVLVSQVGNGHAIVHATHRAAIWYDPIPPTTIKRLIDIGTVMRSCGACALEDPLVAPYVCATDGEGTKRDIRTGILGLPIDITLGMLARFDIRP